MEYFGYLFERTLCDLQIVNLREPGPVIYKFNEKPALLDSVDYNETHDDVVPSMFHKVNIFIVCISFLVLSRLETVTSVGFLAFGQYRMWCRILWRLLMMFLGMALLVESRFFYAGHVWCEGIWTRLSCACFCPGYVNEWSSIHYYSKTGYISWSLSNDCKHYRCFWCRRH